MRTYYHVIITESDGAKYKYITKSSSTGSAASRSWQEHSILHRQARTRLNQGDVVGFEVSRLAPSRVKDELDDGAVMVT